MIIAKHPIFCDLPPSGSVQCKRKHIANSNIDWLCFVEELLGKCFRVCMFVCEQQTIFSSKTLIIRALKQTFHQLYRGLTFEQMLRDIWRRDQMLPSSNISLVACKCINFLHELHFVLLRNALFFQPYKVGPCVSLSAQHFGKSLLKMTLNASHFLPQLYISGKCFFFF